MRFICNVLLATFFSMGFTHADEEGGAYINLVYVGDIYQRVIVLDKKRHSIFNRKLVKGQSFSLPLEFEGKPSKQFFLQLRQRELTIKVGCSKGQDKKMIGAGIIEFTTNISKRICATKSSLLVHKKEFPKELEPKKIATPSDGDNGVF